VLVRLSELSAPPLDAALSSRIADAARARLVPRRVGLLWQIAIPASVVSYLGWALAFTSGLLER
jgi:hypothetical protein